VRQQSPWVSLALRSSEFAEDSAYRAGRTGGKKDPAAAHAHAPTSTNSALKEVSEEARESKSQSSSMDSVHMCVPLSGVVSEEDAALAGLEQFYGLHDYDDDLAWLVQMDPQSLAKKDALSISFHGGNSENAPSNLMHLDSWMSSYTQASEA